MIPRFEPHSVVSQQRGDGDGIQVTEAWLHHVQLVAAAATRVPR
jgi:hypothetical protein